MARPVSNEVPRIAMAPASRFDFVLSGLVAAVFFARFYLPTEATTQGETLWIVGLWLVIGLATSLIAWRSGGAVRRLDWLDASVLLLIGGQVVSAIVVVATTGHKRAAVNVAWEWFGVGIVWFVLRSRVASASFRESFVRASIVTGIVLAGLGLWQHYVSQPQLAAEYGPLFDRLRTASGSEAEAIQRKLAAAGIPTEGPGLTLFEKRLRDSREPMGLFGLANTFGGCLAVWLVMTLGELLAAWRSGRARWRLALPLISVGLIVWCLLLTKSRTAAIGAASGATMLLAGSWSASVRLRRVMLLGGVAVGLLIAVIGVLLQFGGLDREVLSEAPKSLAYRLQYWQATSHLVADHAWFGVGPGNFRPHYLKYKLPEASEEIADPHNLFFDVAATGGAVSLIGLVMLVGLTLSARGRDELLEVAAANRDPLVVANRPSRLETAWSGYWLAGLGPLLAFSGLLTLNGVWEDRLLVLAFAWYLVAWLWQHMAECGSTAERDRIRLACAVFAVLTVHLLGAGGIAMPAVSQLLLALVAMSLAPTTVSNANPSRRSSWMFAVIGIGLVLSAAVFMWTGLVPVMNSLWWQAKGDRLLLSREGRSGAEVAYRAACLADNWSPEPWRRRAELAFERASADRFRSNESFEAAVQLLLEAINRDPHNFQEPRTLGNRWMDRWRETQRGDDVDRAVGGLRRASDSYPTNASILAELAFALDASGQRGNANVTAKRAMDQDELNRKLGHVDRYLANELVTQLRSLTEETDP